MGQESLFNAVWHNIFSSKVDLSKVDFWISLGSPVIVGWSGSGSDTIWEGGTTSSNNIALKLHRSDVNRID